MPKILVVDDEPGMRQVISKILVPIGYEIIGTDEGARALQITKEQNPDTVLLDIRLSDMDCPDVIRGLKNIKPGMPVIILSGFGDVDAAVEMVGQGAFDYISKPFKVNDFINLINKALLKAGQGTLPGKAAEARASVPVAAPAGPSASAHTVIKSRATLKFLAVLFAAVTAAAGGFFVWNTYLMTPGDKEFVLPFSSPSGICFEKNGVWVSDWMEEGVYKYGITGGALKPLGIFKASGQPTGIAFDGRNIWLSDAMGRRITRHTLDAGFTAAAGYESPGPSPSGLCYDGKNLWSLDFQQGRIFKHGTSGKFTVEASYDLPARNPCGVFITGGFAYVADGKTGRIYKFSTETFFLAGVFELPGFGQKQKTMASLGYDGKSVWVCAGGIDRLYRFRMSSLKRIRF